ncbi:MAG: fibronectin type III domain-containing protein, partial [Clostridia bacterium]|nr:fibronectin type III domain-containing protein [Clostridia bacterium]
MKTSKLATRALALLLALVCLLGALPFAASAAAVGTVSVKQTKKTTHTVTITWTRSGSVSGVELLRYNAGAKKYDSLGKTSKTSYKLKGLEPGADYLLALRPFLTAGGKTTEGKAVKLRVYTAINAVPKITQTEATDNSHKLNWKKINGAEKYEVYYYNAETKKFNLLGETANNYVRMVNLKPATLYKYRVRAISVASDGTRILAPASKTFTGYTVPGAVKNFKALEITTTGYRLVWDAVVNAGGYIVSRFDETTGQYEELA